MKFHCDILYDSKIMAIFADLVCRQFVTKLSPVWEWHDQRYLIFKCLFFYQSCNWPCGRVVPVSLVTREIKLQSQEHVILFCNKEL